MPGHHSYKRCREQPRFANARNAIERARLRHAKRLVDDGVGALSRDDLKRLETEDFFASRVFPAEPTEEHPR
ncbi:hypothetical protein AB0H34_37870 [Saccharopolyspora shandongensis]|uniref:hypothetical protein n=1 Tax=Saccharopolyspora shandongensis TaxID=418495 RepID=UPI0033F76F35